MRAIILAAGMGTRLRPLTNDRPKSLVEVAGEPMAERQIRFLKEKGINDIVIATGYMPEKFEYLVEKYGVKLIHNDKYDKYNNIYTMYLVRDYLEDAFVTEADVYMSRNYFKTDHKTSTYYTGLKEGFKDEWIFDLDKNDKVLKINVGDGNGYIMSGVSYWTKEDGKFIKEKLEEAIENRDFTNLYWDNIVNENIHNMNVYIERINSDDWFEIDSIEDLKKAEDHIKSK
ncbi:sugar phosphate nucleotidyltransferase [Clostridium fallax]|uniref:CTP:phosphocholine cytidylyltransferase n=1 Tax=Clostridium fallax TaxID=1533 RepID=A0A1M4VNH6_9CLOT|nr:sugar phosphate nucleotidyltransferase [Clostridium fallax]SHE70435.1 CTP:phosphocholine cytidylyltransferase [Clostridium fallax]SQB22808.1 lic-1 operon protein [Clostridium fallax]